MNSNRKLGAGPNVDATDTLALKKYLDFDKVNEGGILHSVYHGPSLRAGSKSQFWVL